jgi:hypothetical protein
VNLVGDEAEKSGDDVEFAEENENEDYNGD